ncbi:MAG TPA: hypothetical protein VGD57_10670 [Candidatus Dormibacteraeota bacterium]|jgi:hypothetical protein
MTVALPFLIGLVVGFAIRRWYVIVLAPVGGAAILLGALLSSGNASDTPAIFIALLAAVGLALGVLIGKWEIRKAALSSGFRRP